MCFLPHLPDVCSSQGFVRCLAKTLCNSRRKIPSFKGALPGLALAHPAGTGTATEAEQLEEKQASVFRELREKQALMEQRRR